MSIFNNSIMASVNQAVQASSNVFKSVRQQMQGLGNDAKFFRNSKKGEISELRNELCSPELPVMKDAVKKVIAAVTVGKDMGPLFPDVVNCMRTDNVEVKKLVYLYLINYAKSNPDMTIMAVNSFVKDSEHASPLIRALAIRTMGCIRVEKITEYLAPPLKRALKDEDPYVRKTAALCVAKLYEISPAIVTQQGFIDLVRDLLSDANPTVVANAVASLTEIQETSGKEIFELTPSTIQKLLAAVNECTEWGQVFILDSLAKYLPNDAREATNIIERITPRLNHQNPAVVLSTVKIIIIYMEILTDSELISNICKKLAPPLVSLVDKQPEIQYVALRNINIIVQKRPNLLAHKIKVFVCKYTDPIYVKMEKLDILVRLANDSNVDQVLLELKEYASEVDVEYVRRAVRTIGRCAIKLPSAADKCVKVLLQLIQTKVNYVVQEAIVVIKDIFRRYPNRYESIIAVLCASLESLDEPEAKASMVWIIGEYCSRIENAAELLQGFVDSFHDETAAVQLQLLTATVKLFLQRPTESEELVQTVISAATEKSDNPDLRDRGYIYWRLLTSDADAAKAIVLAERPVINDDSDNLDAALLEVLLQNLSTLASVYHRTPESFVRRVRVAFDEEGDDEEYDYDYEDAVDDSGNNAPSAPAAAPASSSNYDDLLGLGLGLGAGASASATPSGSIAASVNPLDDLFGMSSVPAPAPAPAPAATHALPSYPLSAESGGIAVHSGFTSSPAGQPQLDLVVRNSTSAPITQMAVKLNVNSLGLTAAAPVLTFSPPVQPGASGRAQLPLQYASAAFSAADPLNIKIALKDSSGVTLIFGSPLVGPSTPWPPAYFLTAHPLPLEQFVPLWRAAVQENSAAETVKGLPSADPTVVSQKLQNNKLSLVANRPGPDAQTSLGYFTTKTPDGAAVLVEVTFKSTFNDLVRVVVKGPNAATSSIVLQAVANIITH